jgi:hypothetical protein
VLAKPPLPKNLPGSNGSRASLPDSWVVILDAAEEWPYVDPDENGLADPEPAFNDYPSDPTLVPDDIEPFSEEEPWGRMFNETTREYELFSYYRSLGITRSHRDVAEKFSITRVRVGQVAGTRNWPARVQAWDTYRERIYTAELILGVKEMAHHHAEIAREGVAALSIVFMGITSRLGDEESRTAFLDELAELPVKTQLALAQGSARVIPNLMNAERLSRGLPTEISADLHLSETRITIQTTDDLFDIISGLARPLAVTRSGETEEKIIDVDPGGGDSA